jgi:plastocyanin
MNVSKRLLVVVLSFPIIGVVGCSSSPGTTTNPGTTTSQGNTITLSASNLAFNTNTITVQHGSSVSIKFTNNDNGIQHNFALYQSGSASGTATGPIYVGQFISGVSSITYTFAAPSSPGTYFFRCDSHPTMMTGSFIVT